MIDPNEPEPVEEHPEDNGADESGAGYGNHADTPDDAQA